jgi:hypothetical protein
MSFGSSIQCFPNWVRVHKLPKISVKVNPKKAKFIESLSALLKLSKGHVSLKKDMSFKAPLQDKPEGGGKSPH